jgi:hypothetical protein
VYLIYEWSLSCSFDFLRYLKKERKNQLFEDFGKHGSFWGFFVSFLARSVSVIFFFRLEVRTRWNFESA